MAKMSLLSAKSETGFQNFVLAIRHKQMNQDEDVHQTLIKRLFGELVECNPC